MNIVCIVVYDVFLWTFYGSTVADTCLVLFFFLELAKRLEYKAVLIFATRFKYFKRVLNIINVF